MAIDIKFDSAGNPEPTSIILATKSGNKLGQLDVDPNSIELIDKLKGASEISFTLNKYVDGKLTNLWDKVVDLKLVWCKEWDMWFETKVELDEATETVKTVFCTQLGQAELSQIMLYDTHINEEGDSNWDTEKEEYKSTILCDNENHDVSLLHRLLKDKAPHYSVGHVDDTIKGIQRGFSFDGASICDALDEIEEEIGCLVDYESNSNENGMPKRTISVYDLQQNCLNEECKYRGEFADVCPKCGSRNIKYGYGEDTTIFVTADELATEGIQLVTDTDSVKNCFKLEGGDDLMTATIRNCNPNGTDYLWYFSDSIKEDMSDELVRKIDEYDAKYKRYYNEHESILDATLLSKYNNLVDKYDDYYNTSSTCLDCGHKGKFYDKCSNCDSENLLKGRELQKISSSIKGYPALMNAYYNTIDLALYLESGLMPSIEMAETNAEEQASLLTTSALSPVAVNTKDADSISIATANSAVLSMAKVIVKSTFKVEVSSSTLSEVDGEKIWSGTFKITNYSDEEDNATVVVDNVAVNNDSETFIKQKIEKALNKEDTDDYSISGLFEKEYDKFCDELKKYALKSLQSFYDACDSCLNILTEQGAGNRDENPDLYESLYAPYYQKSTALASEISLRESEIAIIKGIYNDDDEIESDGLQTKIENCKNQIQKELDFEAHLGGQLWKEFCSYRREDKYSNSNYISDGLNNAELFERALEFIEVAEDEIYKSAELQHSISATLNNLLAIEKFKPLVKYFKNGNWIRVLVDDKVYKLRLLENRIRFSDFKSIPVEFSDVTKIKTGITDMRNIVEQASSMASSYDSVKRQSIKGGLAQGAIEDLLDEGLDTSDIQIRSNFTINENGLLGRLYDDITKTYSPEQIKITHNIITYTNDGWETVSTALGKHGYTYWNGTEFVDGEDYGLSTKFVTAGYVNGSQIVGGEIYSDNYSITNSTGSYLNLRDGTFSFGGGSLRFEKDKDGNAQLLISSPNIPTTEKITEINEKYLKTATVYAENLQVKAANIQERLTANQINANGIEAVDVKITGIINAENGGTIAGFDIGEDSITHTAIDDNGNEYEDIHIGIDGIYLGSDFYVTNTGKVVANNGIIGGFTIENDYLYNGTLGEDNSIFLSTVDMDGVAGFFEDETDDNEDDITNWRMTVGSNFGVTSNGHLYAQGVDISGFIRLSTIEGGSLEISSEDGATYAKISEDGVLSCTGANISGIVNAIEGYIGGWTVNENGIYSDNNTVGLCSDVNDSVRFYAGLEKYLPRGGYVRLNKDELTETTLDDGWTRYSGLTVDEDGEVAGCAEYSLQLMEESQLDIFEVVAIELRLRSLDINSGDAYSSPIRNITVAYNSLTNKVEVLSFESAYGLHAESYLIFDLHYTVDMSNANFRVSNNGSIHGDLLIVDNAEAYTLTSESIVTNELACQSIDVDGAKLQRKGGEIIGEAFIEEFEFQIEIANRNFLLYEVNKKFAPKTYKFAVQYNLNGKSATMQVEMPSGSNFVSIFVPSKNGDKLTDVVFVETESNVITVEETTGASYADEYIDLDDTLSVSSLKIENYELTAEKLGALLDML